MNIFGYVLLLLIVVLVSNVINRYFSAFSVPLIQMTVGILVSVSTDRVYVFDFVLDPDLFFVLFLAPLIFYEGTTLNIKAMMQVKWPILASAVVLVVLTVIAAGYFVTIIIPSISLLTAFVLISALGPTDSVSVAAVAKRVPVPQKLMNILTGESVMNDATGVTCFQFALAAAVTGAFSLVNATGLFLVLWFGGIIVGVVLTWIKYIIVKQLRSSGLENITFHILFSILTPFIIFIIAEALQVSGILAVLSAGMTHGMMKNHVDPQMVEYHTSRQNVWSTLAFGLEGLVFVLLGTQLPAIITALDGSARGQAVLGVFGITVFFGVSRFLWWILTVDKSIYQEPDQQVHKINAGIIFSLAGARGTVTLASVMSIPIWLSPGVIFPQRDLIILLASGVIVVSMLITNFILPLFVDQEKTEIVGTTEEASYAKIIQKVVAKLNSESTEENRVATAIVTANFSERSAALVEDKSDRQERQALEADLLKKTLVWQKENVQDMLEKKLVDKETASYYLRRLDIASRIRPKNYSLVTKVKLLLMSTAFLTNPQNREKFNTLRHEDAIFILDKLNSARTPENACAINSLLSLYSIAVVVDDVSLVSEVTARGLQIEREIIQEMYDKRKLSWNSARDMRRSIAVLEDSLDNWMT